MELILWRHAEAESPHIGRRDEERQLTPQGQRDAHGMADWLRRHLPGDIRLLASPALRTRQTLSALALPFEQHADFGLDTTAARFLAATGWPDGEGSVLVAGHQPTLGRVAALALTGQEQSWSVKKGSVWWLSLRDREEPGHVLLRAVMTPQLLAKE
jgi:phosphohistidine phosphatase